MVHALEIIHGLLCEDGILIDIRPTPLPARIEVRHGDKYSFAGWLGDANDFMEYRLADQALEASIQRGLFALLRRSTFEFTYRAGTVSDLRAYFATDWKDAILTAETEQVIEGLLAAASGEREMVITETVNIARLIKIDGGIALR